MKMEAALQGVTSVLLDTAPAIYHLENNPVFGLVMERFFHLRAEQGIMLVTSPISLAECLVHPIQQGRQDLEAAYQALITKGDLTVFWPIGVKEGIVAARLRAKYRLKLADAIQVAVALQANCQALLTNDADLMKVRELRILLVADLQPKGPEKGPGPEKGLSLIFATKSVMAPFHGRILFPDQSGHPCPHTEDDYASEKQQRHEDDRHELCAYRQGCHAMENSTPRLRKSRHHVNPGGLSLPGSNNRRVKILR